MALGWSNIGGPADTVRVWRRTAASTWQRLAAIAPESSGQFHYHDAQVSPGVRYGYVASVDQCGQERYFFPETWVEVPAAELVLAGVRPNPAGEDFTVAFTLPDASPAQLELRDLAGRRVLVREVGTLGRGHHVVHLPEARGLRAGVYLVRLKQGSRSQTARAIIIQ